MQSWRTSLHYSRGWREDGRNTDYVTVQFRDVTCRMTQMDRGQSIALCIPLTSKVSETPVLKLQLIHIFPKIVMQYAMPITCVSRGCYLSAESSNPCSYVKIDRKIYINSRTMSLMGYVARMREKSIQNSEERDHFEEIRVEVRIILRRN
jgi:hypothetical protein